MDEMNTVYEENTNYEEEGMDLVPSEEFEDSAETSFEEPESSNGGVPVALVAAGGILLGGLLKTGYDKFVAPKMHCAWDKHKEKQAAKKAEREAKKAGKQNTDVVEAEAVVVDDDEN